MKSTARCMKSSETQMERHLDGHTRCSTFWLRRPDYGSVDEGAPRQRAVVTDGRVYLVTCRRSCLSLRHVRLLGRGCRRRPRERTLQRAECVFERPTRFTDDGFDRTSRFQVGASAKSFKS